MDRREVAQVLEEIAALLELAGENPFKVRAYGNAARAVAGFPGDFDQAAATGRLRELPGIGETISAHIATLAATGRLAVLDELRARFPPGLTQCLSLPGLAAKKVRTLHERLGIDSLESLEKACREGRLQQVPGFGEKIAQRILQGIAVLRSGAGWHEFAGALRRAQELAAEIERTGLARRIEIAGSLRRRREIVRDVDLVAASDDPRALRRALDTLAGVIQTSEPAPGVARAQLSGGLCADLIAVEPEELGSALLAATGSREHLDGLAGRAADAGLSLGPRGLRRADSGERLASADEEGLYAELGLTWIPPELREGGGEIEAAARGDLPHLVERKDLRGLIHVHTTDSDGRDGLEAMVDAVRAEGYEYVAITDHSRSAVYARGLTEERVLAQRARIAELATRRPDVRIFHGTEADILADGSIDYGDGFLAGFDLVVASVHGRFGLSREEQTARLIRAVRNPRVSILGHPSGRLLLSRAPLSADWEAVLAAAADSGCAVEINCHPQRLDLDWRFCRHAAEAGILLSIDPDAHAVAELERIPLGLGIARKGWVTAASVLNARGADELAEWLDRRRRQAPSS